MSVSKPTYLQMTNRGTLEDTVKISPVLTWTRVEDENRSRPHHDRRRGFGGRWRSYQERRRPMTIAVIETTAGPRTKDGGRDNPTRRRSTL